MSSSDFNTLIQLFVQLRGRGLSLSTLDLDILRAWKKSEFDAEFIAQIMIETSEECKQKNTLFPNTLEPISRKLNRILLKMKDT